MTFDDIMECKTPNDRVACYFELITGRRMTRREKIPLGAVIFGDFDDLDGVPVTTDLNAPRDPEHMDPMGPQNHEVK